MWRLHILYHSEKEAVSCQIWCFFRFLHWWERIAFSHEYDLHGSKFPFIFCFLNLIKSTPGSACSVCLLVFSLATFYHVQLPTDCNTFIQILFDFAWWKVSCSRNSATWKHIVYTVDFPLCKILQSFVWMCISNLLWGLYGRVEPGFNACPALCSGSPADVCELLAGDEIVSINGAEVGHHYKESVMHVITQAITSGVLDLRIRRYISSGTSSSTTAPKPGCWSLCAMSQCKVLDAHRRWHPLGNVVFI